MDVETVYSPYLVGSPVLDNFSARASSSNFIECINEWLLVGVAVVLRIAK